METLGTVGILICFVIAALFVGFWVREWEAMKKRHAEMKKAYDMLDWDFNAVINFSKLPVGNGVEREVLAGCSSTGETALSEAGTRVRQLCPTS